MGGTHWLKDRQRRFWNIDLESTKEVEEDHRHAGQDDPTGSLQLKIGRHGKA